MRWLALPVLTTALLITALLNVCGGNQTEPATPTPTPTITATAGPASAVPTPTPTPTAEPTPPPTPTWGWPFSSVAYITGRFGEQRGFDPPDGHHGVDIVPDGDTEIRAIRSGCVVAASWYDGYGLRIVLDHGEGFASLYAHMEEFYVGDGDCVESGQAIGIVDNTGYSTGTHLHLEIRQDGTLIDPLSVLPPLGGSGAIFVPGATDYGLAPDWGVHAD